MTTIDFYTHCADRLDVAARLTAKAWAQHGAVRVLTADELLTAAFSALLWRSPPTGFLPHCRLDSPLAAETPIVVDHRVQHEGAAAVLINLSPAPPPFFSRFERLVEIIGSDDDQTAAGRERWRYYKERGYALRSHSLGGRDQG